MMLTTVVPFAGTLAIDQDACCTGILRCGNRVCLINPGNPGIVSRLHEAGIQSVDEVLFTHHRRELADALPEILAAFSPRISAPAAEVELFRNPETYWASENARWRLLVGHVPYHVTHIRPIAVDRAVADGDEWTFGEWRLRVIETPGYTDGSVTYLAACGGEVAAFTGDLIYGPGRVRDLYSHQHQDTRNGHRVGDYHGFMGSLTTALQSLETVLGTEPRMLIPAHGKPMLSPRAAVDLLRARYVTAYHNYASISALRWYFPAYFAGEASDEQTLSTQETFPLPECVIRLSGTTWALLAEDRRAILIDPYTEAAVAAAQKAVEAGTIAGYDAIWLTHYHYDHMEFADLARERFAIPVWADSVMADVVAHPDRFLLTCLSPRACPVDRSTRDGETWRWRNYTLTAYHFPGQTHYHSGLFAVPDEGLRLFFAGDAVTPTGIDDYCSWNRNFLGPGVGYDRCLRLLRSLAPDRIFNQHVDVGFRFDDDAYERMLGALEERVRLLGDLVPWPHPNFATDEYWVHTYPYEQRLSGECPARVCVRILNHGREPAWAEIEPVLPDGWSVYPVRLRIPCEPGRESEGCFEFRTSRSAFGRAVIPFRIRFGDMNLGTFREAVIKEGN